MIMYCEMFTIFFKFFCFYFVFQEILYGFGEEFFSLHSRRFGERLLLLVTQSAKRDGREKNNCVFCCSNC